MTNGKARSVGSSITIDDTKVGSLTSIDGLKMSSETTDVTTLDSTGGYKEFLGGFKDGGSVPLGGLLDTGTTGQEAMHAAFEDQEVHAFVINFPNGAGWKFNGVVTAFETGASMNDAVSFGSTVKVSGKPELVWPKAQ